MKNNTDDKPMDTKDKRICLKEPQDMDLKRIANSQGMTTTGMLIFAVREFLDKRGIDYKNL